MIGDIDGSHVNSIASLSGETFQITDGVGNKVTFEFIDSVGTTTLTKGDTAVSFNSTTATIATILADMVTAINGATLACQALALPDGTIALYGQNVVATAGTTPFAVMATNPASPNYTAQAMPDGTIALHGPSVVFDPGTTSFSAEGAKEKNSDGTYSFVPEGNLENLDGTTFQITDGSGKMLTFKFVDTEIRTQAATGNVPVFFDPATDTISDIPTLMAAAINGYTSLGSVDAGIRGIDASHVPSIAGLNGKTFQIRDGAGTARTFEFIDLAGSTTLTANDVAVYFNSTASGINMATIRTDMIAAINGANFSCTAQAMPDGSIALYGSNLQLNLRRPRLSCRRTCCRA